MKRIILAALLAVTLSGCATWTGNAAASLGFDALNKAIPSPPTLATLLGKEEPPWIVH